MSIDSSKFRYMQTKYVQKFLSEGTLLLTTYENCRALENETRRDAREGTTNLYFSQGNQVIAGIQGVGKRSYMLCTSSTLSDELLKRFKVEDWIEIIEPMAFAEAISRAIPGFVQLRMAPCRYVSQRSIERRIDESIMPDSAQLLQAAQSGVAGAVEAAFYAMNREMSDRLDDEVGNQTFFLKEESPFAVEDEFRFVWTVDHEVVAPKTFTCMEAVKYCVPGRNRVRN